MMHSMNTRRSLSTIFWMMVGVFISLELQEGLHLFPFSKSLDEPSSSELRCDGINATSSHKENEELDKEYLQEDEEEYEFGEDYEFEWVYLPSDEDHVENMGSEVEAFAPEPASNSTNEQSSFSISLLPGKYYHLALSNNGGFSNAFANTTY